MLLATTISNSVLLSDYRKKEAQIHQQMELTDGAGMALLAPWQGYIECH